MFFQRTFTKALELGHGFLIHFPCSRSWVNGGVKLTSQMRDITPLKFGRKLEVPWGGPAKGCSYQLVLSGGPVTPFIGVKKKLLPFRGVPCPSICNDFLRPTKVGKGNFFWKLSFSDSMLIFGGVYISFLFVWASTQKVILCSSAMQPCWSWLLIGW